MVMKIIIWIQQLICFHEWEHDEFYMGWVMVPETTGYRAMKERRECQKCGKKHVRQPRQRVR